LIGGDWGDENRPHRHAYRLEVCLEGQKLDQHGYLVDILEIEAALNRLIARYQEQYLNDLPEFAGLNPSIEHFSRILCKSLFDQLPASNLAAMTVKLWENEFAWAAYRLER
jgi:6-pyruvoyltetrahydropterin/6-carboxytetrahydropterin synthase